MRTFFGLQIRKLIENVMASGVTYIVRTYFLLAFKQLYLDLGVGK